MVEYVTRPETTPPDDVSGTPFADLDVRTLVSAERQGSELALVGQTIYPAPDGTHEHHLHPDAEEIVIVTAGKGWYRVGDDYYDLRAGDVVFVPKNTAHAGGASPDQDMVIIWVLGGAGSMDKAGYESVAAIPRNR